jgi:hypothetical protein
MLEEKTTSHIDDKCNNEKCYIQHSARVPPHYQNNVRNFLSAHLSAIQVEHRRNAVKVKIKLSLCFNWAPRYEGILGSVGIVPFIL